MRYLFLSLVFIISGCAHGHNLQVDCQVVGPLKSGKLLSECAK